LRIADSNIWSRSESESIRKTTGIIVINVNLSALFKIEN
jgi:hypothetical protein